MAEPVRLAVWSGPRNISTALMRSWGNRPDSIVVDEPLYAHYLAETGFDHPGRDAVIASQPTDWRAVVDVLLGQVPDGVGIFYQKQMTHHLVEDVSRDWIAQLVNVLLIRDPREVVASYIKSRADVTSDEIGVAMQTRLYDELDDAGYEPPIIDSADFLRDPGGYLRALCDWIGVPFDAGMLAWPAGPRDTDGVWAPYWYDAVHASTGFEPYRKRDVHLDGAAAKAANEAMPAYERLHQLRWVLD